MPWQEVEYCLLFVAVSSEAAREVHPDRLETRHALAVCVLPEGRDAAALGEESKER